MKTKKKNRFLVFCFSFLPGAAEMYMGFMKMGLSLMTIFFAMVGIAGWFGLEVLMLMGLVVWCYGFFHANHLASLDIQEFEQVQDEYLGGFDTIAARWKEEKFRKVLSIVLIILGVYLIWETGCRSLYSLVGYNSIYYRILSAVNDVVPRIAIGTLIILAGVKMIQGKKAEINQETEAETEAETVAETKAEPEMVIDGGNQDGNTDNQN